MLLKFQGEVPEGKEPMEGGTKGNRPRKEEKKVAGGGGR